jgi:hypothetical protein
MKRFVQWMITVAVLLASGPVLAQTAAPAAIITAVDAGNFPEMQVFVSATDAKGEHLPGLAPADFSLTENTATVTNLSLLEADLGVQAVFVLDTGEAFKTRDDAGVNRLEYILQALSTFAQNGLQVDADDLTLLAPEGTLVGHEGTRQPILDALNRYTTDFAGTADPLALLNSGLSFAGDTSPRPGMRHTVVLLSNGLRPDFPVTEVVTQALAAQIPIHTVFVGPPSAAETVGSQVMRQLSLQTGGLSVVLEGPQSLNPIFEWLAKQRKQYRLSYRSAIATTGQHSLAVGVRVPGGAPLSAAPVTFQVRVEPPIVTLTALPAQLDLAQAPGDYAVPFEINFPDGHTRLVREAQLVVNDAAVDTRTDGTTLTWPVTAYTESFTATVAVRVTDELGLSAESEPAVVAVLVSAIPSTTAAAMTEAVPSNNMVWIAAGLAVVALALMGGGGYWLWRLRALRVAVGAETVPGYPVRKDPRLAKAKASVEKGDTTPATQPVRPVRRGMHLPSVPLPRFPRPPRANAARVKGKAFFEVLESGSGGWRGEVELFGGSARVGRDGAQADIVFPDLSVSRLHARIEEVSPGVFHLYDEKSTSGTWVNYAQVPAAEGHALKPGDIVNFGRVQLRFKVREWPAANNGPGRASGATQSEPPKKSKAP